jgi:acylphosphatase
MIARSIFIEGKVQGVFFREWTVQRAREIGVSGWVRNRRDGRVEILAVGDPPLVERLIGHLREGSPASEVNRVEIQDAEIERIDGFTRRQTI